MKNNNADVKAKIASLRAELNDHGYLYYTLNEPRITDAEYDKLFMELLEIEKLHPELRDVNSPTSRIGFPSNSSFQKVRHDVKMLSLDNAFKASDVVKFFGSDAEIVVEPKIDGFSLELVYENGVLVMAATRGDGSTGDDVTANARTVKTIPLTLTLPLDIRIRGEVYMTYTVFNRLNVELEQAGESLLANTRNAAAGSIRLKDPAQVAKRGLSFVAYGTPTEVTCVKTQSALTEYFQLIGFNTIYSLPTIQPDHDYPGFKMLASDENAIKKMIGDMDNYRQQLDLATDGLVFKVNDIAAQQELGDGARSPNWAVAFKYPPERKSTTLNAITITVGKTGRITPNAELEPLTLGGTVVASASLCNEEEVARLGCNAGDEVWVEKSAEIIPKIVGVNKKHARTPWKIPTECPSCLTPIEREEGKVDSYCPNKNCPAQILARMQHALGKACLDVDGCGEATVKELISHGIHSLSDFFAVDDLSFLKPAARKKITEGREKAKKAPLWRKLHALGMEGIGIETCKFMAAKWGSVRRMIDDIKTVETDLKKDFDSFKSYFRDNADEVDKLDALGIEFEDDKSDGPLSRKFFVITGTLVSGRRDEVARRIEEAGGTVKSTVTKSVHYLVAGMDCGKTKTDAARRNGTSVITEEELYQLLGKPMPIITADVDPDREF